MRKPPGALSVPERVMLMPAVSTVVLPLEPVRVIGCPEDQRATVRSLGFKKLNQERVVKNTPEIRGMVKKVIHLVTVLEDAR